MSSSTRRRTSTLPRTPPSSSTSATRPSARAVVSLKQLVSLVVRWAVELRRRGVEGRAVVDGVRRRLKSLPRRGRGEFDRLAVVSMLRKRVRVELAAQGEHLASIDTVDSVVEQFEAVLASSAFADMQGSVDEQMERAVQALCAHYRTVYNDIVMASATIQQQRRRQTRGGSPQASDDDDTSSAMSDSGTSIVSANDSVAQLDRARGYRRPGHSAPSIASSSSSSQSGTHRSMRLPSFEEMLFQVLEKDACSSTLLSTSSASTTPRKHASTKQERVGVAVPSGDSASSSSPPSLPSSDSSASSTASDRTIRTDRSGAATDITDFQSMSFSSLPPYDDIRPLSESLITSDDPQILAESLHALLEFGSGDLLSSPSWQQVRQALCRTLANHNPALSLRALDALVDLFHAAVPSVQTGEVYVNLAQHLLDVYKLAVADPNSFEAAMYRDDATTASPTTPRARASSGSRGWQQTACKGMMLKKFRLLSYMQRQLPKYWMNFRDELSGVIFPVTASLVSAGARSVADDARVEAHMLRTPLHWMAVVDPQAVWISQWCVAALSSDRIVDALCDQRLQNDEGVSWMRNLLELCAAECERLSSGAIDRLHAKPLRSSASAEAAAAAAALSLTTELQYSGGSGSERDEEPDEEDEEDSDGHQRRRRARVSTPRREEWAKRREASGSNQPSPKPASDNSQTDTRIVRILFGMHCMGIVSTVLKHLPPRAVVVAGSQEAYDRLEARIVALWMDCIVRVATNHDDSACTVSDADAKLLRAILVTIRSGLVAMSSTVHEHPMLREVLERHGAVWLELVCDTNRATEVRPIRRQAMEAIVCALHAWLGQHARGCSLLSPTLLDVLERLLRVPLSESTVSIVQRTMRLLMALLDGSSGPRLVAFASASTTKEFSLIQCVVDHCCAQSVLRGDALDVVLCLLRHPHAVSLLHACKPSGMEMLWQRVVARLVQRYRVDVATNGAGIARLDWYREVIRHLSSDEVGLQHVVVGGLLGFVMDNVRELLENVDLQLPFLLDRDVHDVSHHEAQLHALLMLQSVFSAPACARLLLLPDDGRSLRATVVSTLEEVLSLTGLSPSRRNPNDCRHRAHFDDAHLLGLRFLHSVALVDAQLFAWLCAQYDVGAHLRELQLALSVRDGVLILEPGAMLRSRVLHLLNELLLAEADKKQARQVTVELKSDAVGGAAGGAEAWRRDAAKEAAKVAVEAAASVTLSGAEVARWRALRRLSIGERGDAKSDDAVEFQLCALAAAADDDTGRVSWWKWLHVSVGDSLSLAYWLRSSRSGEAVAALCGGGAAWTSVRSAVSHLTSLIVAEQLPTVFSTLRATRCPVSMVLDAWFGHAFVRCLPAETHQAFVALCCAYGVDYAAYFAAALLRHCQESIRKRSNQSSDDILQLLVSPLQSPWTHPSLQDATAVPCSAVDGIETHARRSSELLTFDVISALPWMRAMQDEYRDMFFASEE